MKWRVDFPSRIKGRPWLAYDGEHTHHYRQPKAVQLREQAA